jgi:sec-independent protein translocase protein TatA
MGLDNPLHIAFLLVILLLVFGARRLPEIGRSLGSGLREFKQSINGESRDPSNSPDPQPPTLSAGAPQTSTPVQEPVPQRDPAPTDQR